jgi:hypothetical protein
MYLGTSSSMHLPLLLQHVTMVSAARNDASAEPAQAVPEQLSPSTNAEGGAGPEFVAVILAATAGTRLFPLTSEGDDEHEHGGGGLGGDDEFDALPQVSDGGEEGGDGGSDAEMQSGMEAAVGASRREDDDPTAPKHLLPVAGTSILRRLLGSVASAGFSRCVVAVAASDNELTVKSILSEEVSLAGSSSAVGGSSMSRVSDHVLRLTVGDTSASGGGKRSKASAAGASKSMDISIVTLDANCGGSADAIRHLSNSGAVPVNSHLVVIPGDLVLASSLGDGGSLRLLADAHRRGQQFMEGAVASFAPPACTLLLSDVGDEDENGMPLKESAKVRDDRRGGVLLVNPVRCAVASICLSFESY